MKERTINYALHTLNTQYQHYLYYYNTNNPNCKEQEAYYEGMFRMMETLISDGYQNELYIERDNDNKHHIIGGK